MPGLNDILNKPATDIKRPPPIPAGVYTIQLFGKPNFTDKKGQGADFVEFPSKIVAVSDTVTEESIAAFPGGRAALMGHELKGQGGVRFYLTDDSAWRLTEFMTDTLGIEGEGRNVKEMCFDVPGKMCQIEVAQEPTQDGKGMLSRIRSFARQG